jgi:hypothetical protein
MMAEKHLNHIRRPMTDDDILFTNMLVRGLTFFERSNRMFHRQVAIRNFLGVVQLTTFFFLGGFMSTLLVNLHQPKIYN